MRLAVFVIACVIAAVVPVCATPAHILDPRGVPGILDPVTGKFHVIAPAAPAGVNASPITGRIVYNITISIVSAIPTTAPISCSATVDTFDNSSSSFYESGYVPAVRHGSTATCTVSIPYAWPLLTPATDFVGLGYGISASSAAITRESSITLPSIKIPASGTTTTRTLSTVI